jgi:hypothetical protein
VAAQPDATDEAKMEQGREVVLLARRLFPGGMEVSGDGGIEQAIRTTQEPIATQKFRRFSRVHSRMVASECGWISCIAAKTGRWRLIEVKFTTDLKDQHLEDVAIQSRVVSRSGVDLASSCLAHVNRN